jgi:hypothetical protein
LLFFRTNYLAIPSTRFRTNNAHHAMPQPTINSNDSFSHHFGIPQLVVGSCRISGVIIDPLSPWTIFSQPIETNPHF